MSASQGLSNHANQFPADCPALNHSPKLSDLSPQTESSAHPPEAPPKMSCEGEWLEEEPSFYVFGYASLMWNPNFDYKSKIIGYIEGFERRFDQGNVTMRGVPGQPGRVANLVEKPEGRVWGVAFHIVGHEEVARVKQALYTREIARGGYVIMNTTCYPREYHCDGTTSASAHVVEGTDATNINSRVDRDSTDAIDCKTRAGSSESSETESEGSGTSPMRLHTPAEEQRQQKSSQRRKSSTASESAQPVEVLVFTATKNNPLYQKEQVDLASIARQIANAKGATGPNAEYVTKTADYVRQHIPEDVDPYLFELDRRVREQVLLRNHSTSHPDSTTSHPDPTTQHPDPTGVKDVTGSRPRAHNHGSAASVLRML